MTTQHCPGFESNKTLNEVRLECPDCGREIEIFSDEMERQQKCPQCGTKVDPKTCLQK